MVLNQEQCLLHECSAVPKDGAGVGTKQGTWMRDPCKPADSQLVPWVQESEMSFQ